MFIFRFSPIYKGSFWSVVSNIEKMQMDSRAIIFGDFLTDYAQKKPSAERNRIDV